MDGYDADCVSAAVVLVEMRHAHDATMPTTPTMPTMGNRKRRVCAACLTANTPAWRRSVFDDTVTLCNRCGIKQRAIFRIKIANG